MEATTWQTDQMADRHRDPTVTVRPTAEAKTEASAALDARGWTLQEGLLAAIGWIRDDPEGFLANVRTYRPPPKPMGRPRKRDKAEPDGQDLTREAFEDPP